MKYASIKQRISAFWFDTLFSISVFMILGRIFWYFVPGSEIRADAMQLYSEKDFNNFFVTVIASVIFILIYNVFLPLSKQEATLGQKIFKIRLAKANGEKLDFLTSLRRFCLILTKYLMVVLTGPILALAGQQLATSVLGLVLPILIIFLTSVLAWRNSQGAGPVESVGKYRYFDKRS